MSTINTSLPITASGDSSARDFDFLSGKWRVHNKKLRSRLTQCTEWFEFEASCEMQIILNGLGNRDCFRAELDAKPFEAIALRLFNPASRLWSIYWADSRTGVLEPPVVGSFEKNIGQFYARDAWHGIPIIMHFHWDKTNPDVPVWSQAFSADEGQTWEWNWYMTMHRVL